MLHRLTQIPSLKRLLSHIPPGEFIRFLCVGVFNTAWAYLVTVYITQAFDKRIAHGYIVGNIAASVVNISVAFIGYKLFVFKTKGNWLREWVKCLGVYGTGIAISTALLPLVVNLLEHGVKLQHGLSLKLAIAVLQGGTVIFGFIGNKKVTFRKADGLPVERDDVLTPTGL